MKILLLLSGVPYDKGEAIEVVSYEAVRLMGEAGHDVSVQVLIREARNEGAEMRDAHARKMFENDSRVTLLPIIYIADALVEKGIEQGRFSTPLALLKSLPPFRGRINPFFFSSIHLTSNIQGVVDEVNPDVLSSIWSWEALAASYQIKGVAKFVYYGNPNHKPPQAQLNFPALFDFDNQGLKGRFRLWVLKTLNRAREIQHLKMMNMCEMTANNSLVDAQYYTDNGHPNSRYLQNMWPEEPDGPVFGGRGDSEGPVKLAGSVGNLGATGNTFGLYFLGEKLVPELEKRLGKEALCVDVYGGGQPRSMSGEALKRDSIHLRGWVDDLNSELNRSHAFLVLTNVDGFIVGNTRILLAWALGACVVAHANSALSMPEIKHMENALLGETPEQLAELIIKAAEDDQLRERIGRGGFETFQRDYRSDKVVPRMLEAMEQCVDDYRYGRQQRC